jgi:hypothetical protein
MTGSLSRSIGIFALAFGALVGSAATPAAATRIEATASTFIGVPLDVLLTVDDGIDPGKLVMTLEVTGPNGTLADLVGFLAHVNDESLLSGLSITGPDVSDVEILANQIGGPGGRSPCYCDLGFDLGTPGILQDDLRAVTFTIAPCDAGPRRVVPPRPELRRRRLKRRPESRSAEPPRRRRSRAGGPRS